MPIFSKAALPIDGKHFKATDPLTANERLLKLAEQKRIRLQDAKYCAALRKAIACGREKVERQDVSTAFGTRHPLRLMSR